MRLLSKHQKPKVLIDNAAMWTKMYCECLASGQEPDKDLATKYNHPEIKQALEDETHGKCAYCESKIRHISYGDIEHILPKNKDARPELYVEWSNLTLSCEQCNRSGKRTYYNPQLPLINPYNDDPEKNFQAIGPLVYGLGANKRAYATEKTLKLNRSSLVIQRTERIDKVNSLLYIWENEEHSDMKDIVESQLHEEYGEDKEYSFVIKWFLAARNFPVK